MSNQNNNNTEKINALREGHLNALSNPLEIISLYKAFTNQSLRYESGYEHYFNSLPVLNTVEDITSENIFTIQTVLSYLSTKLKDSDWLLGGIFPKQNEFDEIIIAIENNKTSTVDRQGNKELVITRHGDQFTSPIYGYKNKGYYHEELLSGAMKVNTYQLIDFDKKIIRPLCTEIVKGSKTFISDYLVPAENVNYMASCIIQNFKSIGESTCLHFLPEVVEDYSYTLEQFGKVYPLKQKEVSRYFGKELLTLDIGDVVLVRSADLAEYDDHFIVITEKSKMIPSYNSIRPEGRAILASQQDSNLLDNYVLRKGITILKLNNENANIFLSFHNIEVKEDKVIFPN